MTQPDWRGEREHPRWHRTPIHETGRRGRSAVVVLARRRGGDRLATASGAALCDGADTPSLIAITPGKGGNAPCRAVAACSPAPRGGPHCPPRYAPPELGPGGR